MHLVIRVLLVLAALAMAAPRAAHASVVISRIYGGGTGATYTRDFVELHNNGLDEADLTGMALQYATFDGTTWTRVDLPAVVLPPGGYFLILLSTNVGGTTVPPAADLEGAIAPSTPSGKYALTSTQATLAGACPVADLVDLVGYGGANCFEGSAAAPTGSSSANLVRRDAGCTDTNQNGADFQSLVISSSDPPRNSAATPVVCGVSPFPDPVFRQGFENRLNCNGDGSLVVSQLYGGSTGATYKNDFAVLHNRGSTPLDLAGMALQTTSAQGTTWTRLDLPAVLLDPGQFYLVALAANSAGSLDLPPPDLTGTASLGTLAGKVALTATQNTLEGACPTGLVDLVGYGAADCFEGDAPAPSGSSTTTLQRFEDGCADENQNASDLGRFATGVQTTPRNTAAAAVICTCPGS